MSLIKELVDGQSGTFVYLVAQLNKGVTAKGSPYLSMVLQDRSGEIEAKLWNAKPEQLAHYKAGMVLQFNGEVLSHNKQLQMRINDCRIVDPSTVNPADFVKEGDIPRRELKQRMFNGEVLSHNKQLQMRINDCRIVDPSTVNPADFVKEGDIPRRELKQRIDALIATIKNPICHTLILKVMERFQSDFYAYPAASRNHHDFVGGLATHVLRMMEIGDFLASLYPLLNRDLLLSGILMHDIGKCIELSGPVITEYTMEGKLLGHISIMQAIVDEIAKENQLEGEEIILIRHMILSHHGEYEFGSPVLPMIPEAEILHYIDNIDARIQSMGKALNQVEAGEFTARIFALENRSFYKSKI